MSFATVSAYGYTVCIAMLFWGLVSMFGIVQAVLTLQAPVFHDSEPYGIGPSVTSFEAFRMTYDRARQFSSPDPTRARVDTVPEAELRARYATLRADRIEHTVVRARQDLVTSVLQLLVAIGVLLWHWRWLRRITPRGPEASATSGA